MTTEELLRAAEWNRRVNNDRIFLNNPVVMQGLGLAPLIVAASTLQNAIILSVAVLLLLTPARMLAAFLTKLSFFRFRGLTYAVSAGMVYVAVFFVLRRLYTPAQLGLLGLYLPLLCADPIVLKRYERPQRERVKTALKKGLLTALGYVLVLLIVGTLRELLGKGSILGTPVSGRVLFPLAAQPMGGFFVLALLIAVWRGLVGLIKRQLNMEVSAAHE